MLGTQAAGFLAVLLSITPFSFTGAPASTTADVAAIQAASGRDAMEFLGRMVGGAWHQGDDFFQTFEWGAGRQAIRAKGYFVVNGEPKLVSEGIWYWHPADRVVRAYGVAIDMPMVLWEYETALVGSELQHVLVTYTAAGERSVVRELWTFSDADHYEWTLLEQQFEGEWVRRMGGPFERRGSR